MKIPEPVRLSLTALAIAIVGVLLLAWSPLLAPADAEMVRAGVSISLPRALIAFSALIVILRVSDWITRTRFPDVRQTIESNPYAAAIYYGARYLAVGLLLASIFS